MARSAHPEVCSAAPACPGICPAYEAGGLFRVVAPAVIELRRRRVAVPGCFLHVLQLSAILQRRGDERRPHRVGGITPRQADAGGIFPHHAVDGIRVELARRVVRLGVAAHRSEKWPLMLGTMPGPVQISTDPLRGLGMDSQGIAPPAFAGQTQRIKATVLVQVAHGQGGDLRPAQPYLQAHRKDGAITQTG